MKGMTIAVLATLGMSTNSLAGEFVTYKDQAVIHGEYIVVFSADATKAATAESAISKFAAGGEAKINQRWQTALHGMAISNIDEATAREIASTSGVESVSQNAIIYPSAVTQTSAPSQLDRIDQYNLPTDGKYTYLYRGTGVNAYIIDGAIRTSHNDFRPPGNPSGPSRATNDVDIVGGGFAPERHGTLVASIVGGVISGVAKDVRIHGVKVANGLGIGSKAWLLGGIDWVARNGIRPAVVNISWNWGTDATMKAAVESLVSAGFFVSVSAGNSEGDACADSIAGANGVYTVAGMTDADESWSFQFNSGATKTGPCVSAYARVIATGAGHLSDTSYATDAGTSFAAPIASGIAAQVLQVFPGVLPSAVNSELNSQAIVNKVTGIPAIPAGTPNRILKVWP